MPGADYVGEIFAGKANGGTKAHYASASGPITKTDGYSVGIVLFKPVDIFSVLNHIGPELFFEGCIHVRYGMQCS